MNRSFRILYKVFLSISIILSALCLMAQCVAIYQSGEHPFSAEAVSAAFAPIAFPVYVSLALIAGGWVWDIFQPEAAKKAKPEKQERAILHRLCEKLDTSACRGDILQTIAAERKARLFHQILSAFLLFSGSIVFLCYGLNGRNFPSDDLSRAMVRAMGWLLPCMAIPFGYSVFTVYYQKKSLNREITLVKSALADGRTLSPAPIGEAAPQTWAKLLRLAIFLFAVGILLYGFASGGTKDVLTKAVNICTECVGLG